MVMKKCPVCGEWFGVWKHSVDFVHKCVKADKSRMTADNEKWKIPGRQNQKIYGVEGWNAIARNVPMPYPRKRKSDIVDNLLDDTNVDTYIRFK